MLIRNKTRKHFIYKWLKEDLYGEYTFRKSLKSRLACFILIKIWCYIIDLRARYYEKKRRYRVLPPRFRRGLVGVIAKHNLKFAARPKIGRRFIPRDPILKQDSFFLNFIKGGVTTSYYAQPENKDGILFSYRNKMMRTVRQRPIIVLRQRRYVVLKPASFLVMWHKQLSAVYRSTGAHFRRVYPGTPKYFNKKPKRRNRFEVRTFFENLVKPREVRVYDKTFNKEQTVRVNNLHTLRYYNLINTTQDYLKLTKNFSHNFLNNSRRNPGNFISLTEGRLVSVLLRSGFFENGYAVSNLIKRGPFQINGFPVKFATTIMRQWDAITITKPLWWYVYSRLYAFLRDSRTRYVEFYARGRRWLSEKKKREIRKKNIEALYRSRLPLRKFFQMLAHSYTKNVQAVFASVHKRKRGKAQKPRPLLRRRPTYKKGGRFVDRKAYLKKKSIWLAHRRAILRFTAAKIRFRYRMFASKIIETPLKRRRKLPKFNLKLLGDYKPFKYLPRVLRNRGYRGAGRYYYNNNKNQRRPWKKKPWFPTYREYKIHTLFAAFKVQRDKLGVYLKKNKKFRKKFRKIQFFKKKRIKSIKITELLLKGKRRMPLPTSRIRLHWYHTVQLQKIRKIGWIRKNAFARLRNGRPKYTKPIRRLPIVRMILESKRANRYHIIAPAAPYIELSYKLFTIILFRLPHKAIDTNISTSLTLVSRFSKNISYRFKRFIIPRSRGIVKRVLQ